MSRRKDCNTTKSIAKNIKSLRNKIFPGRGGMSLAAGKFRVSTGNWSQWESGKTTPDEVNQRKLADFFGVSLSDLRGEHTPKPNWSKRALAANIRISRELKYPGHDGPTMAAKAFGVSLNIWNKWEAGEISPDVNSLEELAKFFQRSTASLLGEDVYYDSEGVEYGGTPIEQLRLEEMIRETFPLLKKTLEREQKRNDVAEGRIAQLEARIQELEAKLKQLS